MQQYFCADANRFFDSEVKMFVVSRICGALWNERKRIRSRKGERGEGRNGKDKDRSAK